jgi:hypothetical protein
MGIIQKIRCSFIPTCLFQVCLFHVSAGGPSVIALIRDTDVHVSLILCHEEVKLH